MLIYTGKDTKLISKVHGIDMSQSSKPSKAVFTLADRLLKLSYILGLDNYYRSQELLDVLNDLDTADVRPNRKLPKGVMGGEHSSCLQKKKCGTRK
jgi:hypothetical protein